MLAKPFSPAVTGWGHGQSELLSSFLSSASLCLCWHQPWPHWCLSLRWVQNHLNKKWPDIFIKCISSLMLETSTNSCYGYKCIWIPDFLLFREKWWQYAVTVRDQFIRGSSASKVLIKKWWPHFNLDLCVTSEYWSKEIARGFSRFNLPTIIKKRNLSLSWISLMCWAYVLRVISICSGLNDVLIYLWNK